MLKIRHIWMLMLCVLMPVIALHAETVTSTASQSTLYNNFDDGTKSVSWTAPHITFTFAGDQLYTATPFLFVHYLYMPNSLLGVATYTISWSVDEDYIINVTKVAVNVDRASGHNYFMKVGNGTKTDDLYYSSNIPSGGVSSGVLNYGNTQTVQITVDEVLTWSTVAVNSITITYTLIPKFIFKGNGSGSESDHLKWEQADNWLPNALPTISDSVFIRHDVVVSGKGEAKSVTIESPNKVTVAPTGTLKVGDGGIIGATEDNFKLQAGTGTEVGGNGYAKGLTGVLLIDPGCTEPMPSATAEMYSKAYFDMNGGKPDNNAGAYQYVGSPMEKDETKLAKETSFTNSWIYSWEEATGEWKNNRKNLILEPFVGYCTSQYASSEGILIEHKGQLASNGDQVLNLSFTATSAEPGINVLANSYTAPIDITQFIDGDFVGDVEKTIYLFNTGSKNDVKDHPELNGDLAGQFIAIPIHLAGTVKDGFLLPAVIPAMQGFYVKANSAGSTLTLNYERLVWNATHSNTPLRAKRAEEQQKGSLCVMVEAEGWRDQVFLLESEEYDAAFENGYDAHKLMQGNLNIFTVEGDEALAVDATNSIAGTRIGVRTGAETAYTLTFGALSGETEWSLYDAETQATIDIEEGMQYTFFAEPNSEIRDRFYITERNDAPAITTDLEKVGDGAESRKFIKDGRLFVMKNGLIYNMLGVVVSR